MERVDVGGFVREGERVDVRGVVRERGGEESFCNGLEKYEGDEERERGEHICEDCLSRGEKRGEIGEALSGEGEGERSS